MSKPDTKKDIQIVLNDLRRHELGHGQSSWDWEADFRFAKEVGTKDEIEILQALLKSSAVFAHQIAVHKARIRKLAQRRIRALRKLYKMGLVDAFWLGTGHGGYSEFGIRRIRTWILKTRRGRKSARQGSYAVK